MDRGELFKRSFVITPLPAGGFLIRTDEAQHCGSQLIQAFSNIRDLMSALAWHASAIEIDPKSPGAE